LCPPNVQPGSREAILCAWIEAGLIAAGTDIGALLGGGAGLLTGPGAVIASPAGAIAGGTVGAGAGFIAGSGLTNWLFSDNTGHGRRRAQEGNAGDPKRLSQDEVDYTIQNFTKRYSQPDGASVFVRTVNGRSNVVIQNESGDVITNMRGLTQRELGNLARNYGWY
jgi:hypothetical protein